MAYDDLDAQGGCSCSCGNDNKPSSVTCSEAKVSVYSSTSFNCNVFCQTGCPSVKVPEGGTCVALNGNFDDYNNWYVGRGTIQSATCKPAELSNSIAQAEFQVEERYCAAPSEGYSCSAGGTCVPQLDEGLEPELCIYRDGDHECPADYTEKTLRFQSFNDDRACSACECEEPTGSCGGAVSGHSASSCSDLGIAYNAGCTAQPSVLPAYLRYHRDSNLSCTPTGGELVGSAEAAEPVTVCCQAPAE
jgi:hypothetical protein